MSNLNKGKPHPKLLQNLERLYKLAIEQELPFPFFKALHGYMNFAFGQPKLKRIIEEQMTQRNKRYENIKKTEVEAIKEMRLSKNKILSIIKRKKIDTSNFSRHSTMAIGGLSDNVVSELEALENEKIKISSSISYSGTLHAYLFDISANLRRLGYEKELGSLVVSAKDYNNYYQHLKGTSGYFFSGNENGNFVFSKTWPEKFEQESLLSIERVLKPWGAFEKAIQFMRAFHNVITNTSTWKITEITSPYDYLLEENDLADVFHMTEDFYHISGQGREDSARRFRGNPPSELDILNYPLFKNFLQIIHGSFLESIDTEESKNEFNKIILHMNPSGELYRDPKAKHCYPMGEKSDRCKIIKFLTDGGYKETRIIVNELGNKKEQTVRTEITKINKNVKNKLNINNFIEGKKGSGYRINPKYKVVPINE